MIIVVEVYFITKWQEKKLQDKILNHTKLTLKNQQRN